MAPPSPRFVVAQAIDGAAVMHLWVGEGYGPTLADTQGKPLEQRLKHSAMPALSLGGDYGWQRDYFYLESARPARKGLLLPRLISWEAHAAPKPAQPSALDVGLVEENVATGYDPACRKIYGIRPLLRAWLVGITKVEGTVYELSWSGDGEHWFTTPGLLAKTLQERVVLELPIWWFAALEPDAKTLMVRVTPVGFDGGRGKVVAGGVPAKAARRLLRQGRQRDAMRDSRVGTADFHERALRHYKRASPKEYVELFDRLAVLPRAAYGVSSWGDFRKEVLGGDRRINLRTRLAAATGALEVQIPFHVKGGALRSVRPVREVVELLKSLEREAAPYSVTVERDGARVRFKRGEEAFWRANDPPLVRAATTGNLVRVRRLLTEGADANSRDVEGGTALGHAAVRGHLDIVRTLLKAGADPDLDKRGSRRVSTLEVALVRGHQDCVRALVDAGARVDAALDMAIKENRPDDFRLLLKGVHHPDSCEKDDGRTALFTAARSTNSDFVKLLLERGANPNHRDQYGRTPLMAAGHPDTIALLILHGALPNAQDRTGLTALHFAAGTFESLNRIDALLKGGASKTIKDQRGRTPLDVAREYKSKGRLPEYWKKVLERFGAGG